MFRRHGVSYASLKTVWPGWSNMKTFHQIVVLKTYTTWDQFNIKSYSVYCT